MIILLALNCPRTVVEVRKSREQQTTSSAQSNNLLFAPDGIEVIMKGRTIRIYLADGVLTAEIINCEYSRVRMTLNVRVTRTNSSGVASDEVESVPNSIAQRWRVLERTKFRLQRSQNR